MRLHPLYGTNAAICCFPVTLHDLSLQKYSKHCIYTFWWLCFLNSAEAVSKLIFCLVQVTGNSYSEKSEKKLLTLNWGQVYPNIFKFKNLISSSCVAIGFFREEFKQSGTWNITGTISLVILTQKDGQ